MTSPVLELQGAVVARLKGDASLTAIIGKRVYDAVPGAFLYPYVSIGPSDETSDDADCVDGFDVTMQIDCWSRGVGYTEVLRIADAVREALKSEPVLADNALVYFAHRITRTFRDADPLTSHAAVTFQAFIEQP